MTLVLLWWIYIWSNFYYVSCCQVAILGECSENITEIAFEYGKNIGIAFQVTVHALCDKFSLH